MPSPLFDYRGKKVYKRKGKGGRKLHIKGKGRYQIYSKRLDRKRKSHARPKGTNNWHVGDFGGLHSKSRI